MLPLDLHVLGLPLAFILSQDQTLHCISLNVCPTPGNPRVPASKWFVLNSTLSLQYVYELLNSQNRTFSTTSLFFRSYPSTSSVKRLQIYNCFLNRQAFFKKNQNIFLASKNNLLHELFPLNTSVFFGLQM